MASSARASQPSWGSSFQERGIPGARLKLRFRLKMLLRAWPESTELCQDMVRPLIPQPDRSGHTDGVSVLMAGCCHPPKTQVGWHRLEY